MGPRFKSERGSHFLYYIIYTYVEVVAEMTILAMAMFLAAFFCLRVLILPDSPTNTIERINEVEKIIHEK